MLKKITFLMFLLFHSRSITMEDLQELRAHTQKIPKVLQKLLAMRYHEAHDWKSISLLGSCYVVEKNVIMSAYATHIAHPWRYTQNKRSHTLQFMRPDTHQLIDVLQLTFNDNAQCHSFIVVGPNDNQCAIINNAVCNLSAPEKKFDLPVKKGETMLCIHPTEPLCASLDIKGNIYVYSWKLAQYCLRLAAQTVKRKKIISYKNKSNPITGIPIAMEFGPENQLYILEPQAITIIDYEKNNALRTIDINKLLASHKLPDEHGRVTNFSLCPTNKNIMLISYRIFKHSQQPFLDELTMNTKRQYALYDLNTQEFFPCDIEVEKEDGKLGWGTKIQSYQRREVHNCNNRKAAEQPEILKKSLMYYKNQDQMLNTLHALWEIIQPK